MQTGPQKNSLSRAEEEAGISDRERLSGTGIA